MRKKAGFVICSLFLCAIIAARIASPAAEVPAAALNTDDIYSTPSPTDDDLTANSEPPVSAVTEAPALPPEREDEYSFPSREEIADRFADDLPYQWGEDIDGVISRFETADKSVVITLDACGWGLGSGYDERLIEFLVQENVPATLFISGKWIEDNPETFAYLAGQDNFEIENHGYQHKPLSVDGREQYGIAGTASPGEVYDEIVNNAVRIYELTGKRPRFFRTGTAYYDEVAVRIARELGVGIAGFTIAGDAGATLSAEEILSLCRSPEPGSIFLFHMNHPESGTADGIRLLVPELRQSGYNFVLLSDAAENPAG